MSAKKTQRRRNAGGASRMTGGGSILVVALQSAPRLLESFGVDPATAARRAGLDLRVLADPESRIPFSLLGRFMAECVRATRCEHFGLQLGAEEGLGALGVVGHFVQHASDVGTALRNLSSFLHHQETGGTVTLSVERGVAVLDYAIELSNLPAADQIADSALGIAMSLMRFLCGEAWTPHEVLLMHERPRDVAPYRRVFQAPVRFGAERNALLFSARWLEHRIQTADPVMRKILESKITELETGNRAELPAQMRGIIRAMLLSGESSSDAVAHRLSITRRTLHRRLQAHGVTFEQLLDRLRFDLAQQLLRHSTASMTDIAVALNYANASAFTRAFRRWSGGAPSRWRDENQPSAQ
jgi:AraC-like DNA-binding protein